MARSWLIKNEPDCYSFQDLQRDGVSPWEGVRNYQARNFMRDDMRPGDRVLYYHSSIGTPAVVGLAEVASEPYPDPTQFDPDSEYYDPKATPAAPRWLLVDFKPIKALPREVSLAEMKEVPELAEMRLLARGNRLSVMPVEDAHFDLILAMAGAPPDQ
ncbi:MAG TPA: EVE domain-containing protein [Trueperaceae bacterium]|nr:EVE domain-containing protein [Trueperaceae bacterium]